MQCFSIYPHRTGDMENPPAVSFSTHPAESDESQGDAAPERLDTAFWELETTGAMPPYSLPREDFLPRSFRVSKRWGAPQTESGVEAV